MATPLFDPERNPFEDVSAALEQARRERKNVLIDLGGDWCIWCHRLEAFIAEHPELAELRDKHYVTVRIFISDSDGTNMDFLEQLPPFTGVPHLYVYNARGSLLCSQATEPFEVGESYDLEKIRAFLQEWSDWRRSPYDALSTAELKQRFEQYLRSNDDRPTLSA
ncbi:MAG: hypothetical protein Fur005_08430 [Roseiflexaceae bacterium]